MWHTNELGVSNSMNGSSPRRARDDIELAHRISLSVFSQYSDTSTLFFCDGTKPTIDDNIKAVADVLGTPQDLPGVDLDPVERTIDV